MAIRDPEDAIFSPQKNIQTIRIEHNGNEYSISVLKKGKAYNRSFPKSEVLLPESILLIGSTIRSRIGKAPDDYQYPVDYRCLNLGDV